MSAQQIGDALKARLGALAFSPAIPVAWQGVDFTPPKDGGRFLAAQIVPAPNERLTIGSETRRSGTFVVTVASKGNAGTREGEGIADAVAAQFPVDLVIPLAFGRLRITAAPSIRGAFMDAGFWRTPVAIPYEVLA
jgi:hypothetical protein